jgi:hypothetical protein
MVGDVGALGSSDPDTAISEWVGGELKFSMYLLLNYFPFFSHDTVL